jgi:hypothetical protein
MLANWSWVFIGNLIGSVVYGALLAITLTDAGHIAPAGVAPRIIEVAQAKTTGYEAFGAAGMLTAFVKAILCNWMVCLGVVMAMSSTSTIGRIAGAWGRRAWCLRSPPCSGPWLTASRSSWSHAIRERHFYPSWSWRSSSPPWC